ncbi:hypothetical protein V6N13_061396 [Hibiscus sabdariffa]
MLQLQGDEFDVTLVLLQSQGDKVELVFIPQQPWGDELGIIFVSLQLQGYEFDVTLVPLQLLGDKVDQSTSPFLRKIDKRGEEVFSGSLTIDLIFSTSPFYPLPTTAPSSSPLTFTELTIPGLHSNPPC